MKASPILSCSPWLFPGKGLSLPVFAFFFFFFCCWCGRGSIIYSLPVRVIEFYSALEMCAGRGANSKHRFKTSFKRKVPESGARSVVEVACTWPSRTPRPRMVLTVPHSQCGRKATLNLNSSSFSAEVERRPEIFPQKTTNVRAVNGLTFSVNGTTVNGPLPYQQRIDSVCVME